jgi:hypothetical protein
MIYPSPDVLSRLIQERQARLQAAVLPSQAFHAGLRVRIGHALIAAGSTLSGERVELLGHHHRRRSLSRAA